MRQGNEVALLYPATSPKKVPTAAAKTMAMSATDKEFCPPTSMAQQVASQAVSAQRVRQAGAGQGPGRRVTEAQINLVGPRQDTTGEQTGTCCPYRRRGAL